jgi:DNA invertase Pin-like site-specific DNA recombinase
LRGKFFSYLRVSTDRQGERGHGLDAQRKAVADYLNGGAWELMGEFVEVESGKRNGRPKLAEALAACKKHHARLVIAKLDRLSRNVAFIATLMDGKIDFVCCDFPSANRLTLHILAAVAEHEREMIAKRTKEGLAAAKAKGVVLGNRDLAAANKAGAIERARAIGPALAELAGLSARAAAAELNTRKVATPTGAPWSAKTVIRARERLAISCHRRDAGGVGA